MELITDKSQFWDLLKSGYFRSMIKESSTGKHIYDPYEVYNVMKPIFAEHPDIEQVYCIYMTTKNEIILIEKMFSGSISGAAIYPREIIKKILLLKATGLIMVHNHPSGNHEPSSTDRIVTLKLGFILKSIDVSLHDHIIVGDGYHSMNESGFMEIVGKRFKRLFSDDTEMTTDLYREVNH